MKGSERIGGSTMDKGQESLLSLVSSFGKEAPKMVNLDGFQNFHNIPLFFFASL